MPVLLTLIIGAAVGFLATRMYGMNTNVPTTVGIGVLGAIVGGLVLRGLVTVFATLSGVLPIFIGGLVGAFGLLWIYKTYFDKK